MSGSTMVALALSIMLATTGQLLLKAGMDTVGVEIALEPTALVQLLRSIVTSWRLMLGLTAFGSSAVFWLVALSRLPLSTAYPVVSLSYVLVLGFGMLLLGERPSLVTWAGALLVMSGVAVIGIGQR
jgi:undecaprenyl phosphate-alpha-L-ara4N flippase subunit ArnF